VSKPTSPQSTGDTATQPQLKLEDTQTVHKRVQAPSEPAGRDLYVRDNSGRPDKLTSTAELRALSIKIKAERETANLNENRTAKPKPKK
jgi:hypothetical protein